MIQTSAHRDTALVSVTQLRPSDGASASSVVVFFVSSFFRLDNRPELTRELGLPAGASDDELLIQGWRAWGADLPDKLRGAFAFALFLPREGTIFAARDVFGLSPVYYALVDGVFCIGSSSRRVRAILPKSPHNNELMIADFVSGIFLERDQTFFSEIMRLPPAHHMSVTSSDISLSRYWSMRDIERDRSPSDAPETFRALFDRAVANCMGDENPVLLISGGLDSSAVAASVRAQNASLSMQGASMTFPMTDPWHDGPYLRDLCQSLSIDLFEVPSDDHNPLADMEHWLEAMDGPYLPYGQSISFRLLPMIRNRGSKLLLSGHGGDEIVSNGFGRLNELAKAGKWFQLWRETKAVAANFNQDTLRTRLGVLKRFGAHLSILRAWWWIRNKWAPPPVQEEEDVPQDAAWLSSRLQEQVGTSRYDNPPAYTRRNHDERMLQEDVMGLALNPLSLEVYSICAEASGVEIGCPFFDRDLFEFSLSLSSDWKLRSGSTRYILRAAMGEDWPQSIRSRPDKFDFGGNFMEGLLKAKDQLLRLTDPTGRELGEFVNLDKLAQLREKLLSDQNALERVEAFFLWRVAMLSLWLDLNKRPLSKPALQNLAQD